MRTISIEKPSGTFFKTCEPQNRTVVSKLVNITIIKNNKKSIINMVGL